jgi:putative transcriptional regulator
MSISEDLFGNAALLLPLAGGSLRFSLAPLGFGIKATPVPVWTGAQLSKPVAGASRVNLSCAFLSALFTKQPSKLKLETLAALCTELVISLHDTSGEWTGLKRRVTRPQAGVAPDAGQRHRVDSIAGLGR